MLLKYPVRVNSLDGLPEEIQNQLTNNNHILKHENYLMLLTVYIKSLPILGLLGIILIPISVIFFFRSKLYRSSIIFLYFLLLFKLFFYGTLGATGDYTRYSDESRLITSILLSLFLKLFFKNAQNNKL